MVPRIQAGDHDGAVNAGIAAVVQVISGQGLPAAQPRNPNNRDQRGNQPLTLGQMILYGVIAIFVLIFLVTHPTLAFFLLANLLSGGDRGDRGGGWGGGGGGGFGGGGGMSGGGGARRIMVITRRQLLRAIDKERIKTAIIEGEHRTSGEICVSVSPFFWGKHRKGGEEGFCRLGMTRTRLHNGVLFFVVTGKTQICHSGRYRHSRKSRPGVLACVAAVVSEQFRGGKFTEGLVRGIGEVADQLAEHFPTTRQPMSMNFRTTSILADNRRKLMISVTPELSVPDEEITFTASRSSGPGGQNVNKVAPGLRCPSICGIVRRCRKFNESGFRRNLRAGLIRMVFCASFRSVPVVRI